MKKELTLIKEKRMRLLNMLNKLNKELEELKLREKEALKDEFYMAYVKSHLSYEEFIKKISKE